jgi:hypothetical protein
MASYGSRTDKWSGWIGVEPGLRQFRGHPLAPGVRDCVAGLRGLEPANVISKIFLQLARERSQVPKGSGYPRRICPTFQQLSQNDVCEFESYMPSHAVGSLLGHLWGNATTSLCICGGASASFPRWRGGSTAGPSHYRIGCWVSSCVSFPRKARP